MAELPLAEKVVLLARVLTQAQIPFAFGGALAFAYYGEPRATVDIDLNLFVATEANGRVMKVIEQIGVTPPLNTDALLRDG